MKIVRFTADRKAEYGILDGGTVNSLSGTPFQRIKLTGRSYKLNDVRLMPPCLPSKIVALGLNYRSHAKEVNLKIPSEPLIFIKPSTSVIGPEDNIVYPESSQQVDYEGELGVVIKKTTRQVSAEEAGSYIL